MANSEIPDAEILAFLDEMLPVARASVLESALRDSPDLRQRAALLARRRDQGGHTVGEIWRRHRLSCPTRGQLGSWLLNTLDDSLSDYVEFHLRTVGCRVCQANLEDLQQSQAATGDVQRRRRKFFESSAGVLRGRDRRDD